MAGTFIRGMKIEVDHGTSTARVVPPDGAPEWWETEIHISHGDKTVRVEMLGVTAIFECLVGLGNYDVDPAATGVDFVDDIDGTRVGQRIWLDPWLPSTNDYVHAVTLLGYTGDPRALTLGHFDLGPEAGFDNLVSRVEVFLMEDGVEVAPVVGGVYTFQIRFTGTPPA